MNAVLSLPYKSILFVVDVAVELSDCPKRHRLYVFRKHPDARRTLAIFGVLMGLVLYASLAGPAPTGWSSIDTLIAFAHFWCVPIGAGLQLMATGYIHQVNKNANSRCYHHDTANRYFHKRLRKP